MNGNELLDKLELVDATYLEAAEKACRRKNRIWLRLGALAACFCLLTAAAVMISGLLPGTAPPVIAPPAETTLPTTETTLPPSETVPPTTQPPVTAPKTSDTYTSLSQLLTYLSDHDEHGGRGTDGTAITVAPQAGSAEANLLKESSVALDVTGQYLYSVGKRQILISKLEGETFVEIGSLDVPVGSLMIWGDNMLVLSHSRYSGTDTDPIYQANVSIYDITVPDSPVLNQTYSQIGTRNTLWMADGKLYLITGDGMCACGWSRLEDPAGYYPALWHNGTPIEWADEDISILGEPTRVQYIAVTVIDTETWEVLGKEAVYGNIRQVYYGEDWVAAAVALSEDCFVDNSILYTFDGQLNFTGKIDTNCILGVTEPMVYREDGVTRNGEYVELVSVTRQDGVYRLLGYRKKIAEGQWVEETIAAMAVQSETGEATVEQLDASAYYRLSDICWDGDHAILSAGHNFTRGEDRLCDLLLVEFEGMSVSLWNTGLQSYYHDSTVAAGYGDPLGEFEPMIPLGNGLYVCYSLPQYGPTAFDLFDFSDIHNPKHLYRAEQSFCGTNSFDFMWYVYDDHTFGTLKVILNYEAKDYYRDVRLVWCRYRVDPNSETPFTLLSETPLEGRIPAYSSFEGIRFSILSAGDQLYYIKRNSIEEALQPPLPLE